MGWASRKLMFIAYLELNTDDDVFYLFLQKQKLQIYLIWFMIWMFLSLDHQFLN